MELLIGIDIGTASTKGVLVDAADGGRILTDVQRKHSIDLPGGARAEMDATIWWRETVDILGELNEVARGQGRAVAGVCVSGMGPCVLQVDAELTPRTPAILYGVDGRAAEQIDQMNRILGEDEILRRGGSELSSQAVGPKLKWLIDNTDGGAADRWYGCHTWVLARLAGPNHRWVLDHHSASQCDPLYDIAAQDWATDLADRVLPGTPLPELVWPGEVIGTLGAEAAAATRLAEGTPLVCGTVDAWAESFSAGVRRPGDLMLMYGSTLFFVQVLAGKGSDGPTSHRGLWTTSGVEAGTHTLAAGMSTSGSLTQWVQELTGDAPFETLVEEAGRTPPGSDGLVTLPYFAGERSPIYDPQARGLMLGLTLRHTRGHLFRSVYEGIACGVRQIVQELSAVDAPARRVFAVGGGTQGRLWTQIVSDITGLEQTVPATTLGAAYGDALLAAIGLGIVAPETDWSLADQVITPDPAHRATYQKLFEIYDSLYPATKPQMHALAGFSVD